MSGWPDKDRFVKDGVQQHKGICAAYGYAGKANLNKYYWNPKRKLGVSSDNLKVSFCFKAF